jgi:hypothetical protein
MNAKRSSKYDLSAQAEIYTGDSGSDLQLSLMAFDDAMHRTGATFPTRSGHTVRRPFLPKRWIRVS